MCSVIVWVKEVVRKSVVGDYRLQCMCSSHHQSKQSTVMMTALQVTVIHISPPQDSSNPDDHSTQCTVTPGIKPLTTVLLRTTNPDDRSTQCTVTPGI